MYLICIFIFFETIRSSVNKKHFEERFARVLLLKSCLEVSTTMQLVCRRPLLKAAGWNGNLGWIIEEGMSRDDYNIPRRVMTRCINLVIFPNYWRNGNEWEHLTWEQLQGRILEECLHRKAEGGRGTQSIQQKPGGAAEGEWHRDKR